jgi:hypothetical protein
VFSDHYHVIQNSDVIDKVESVFSDLGKEFKKDVKVVGNGTKVYAEYDFPLERATIPQVGDDVSLTLKVLNSFDGSLKVGIKAGFKRLVCSNGMISFQKMIELDKRHIGKIDIGSVLPKIATMFETYSDNLKVFADMAQVGVSTIQGVTILENLVKAGRISDSVREDIQTIWENPTYKQDEARNLYNLYNAFTQHNTHGIASERFEMSQRLLESVSVDFAKLGRDTRYLNQMTVLQA